VAFGCGGYLLQQVNRDTQKFAMKCSAAKVDNKWRDVYKDPVTDTGKRSKKGRVTLMEKNGEYMSFLESDIVPMEHVGWKVALDTVYEYGTLVKEVSFDQVRANAAGNLN
jgi:nicotinamide phosphoribosyltransferase